MRKSKKATIIGISIFVVFMILIIVGTVAVVYGDEQYDVKFTLNGTKLDVKDMLYPKLIDFTNAEISWTEPKIPLAKKINGSGFENVKKGKFTQVADGNAVYLCLLRYNAKSILIDNGENGGKNFINCKTEAETDALYERIINAQKQL